MDKKTLYVIILNYNNAPDTIECIRSLDREKELEIHAVVVDNGSVAECVRDIQQVTDALGNAVFIQTGKNLGYAGGNNIGIKYAIEHGADYIAIVNNDTIVNETTFAPCIRILDTEPDVGLAGPVILLNGTDTVQYAGGNVDFWTLNVNRLLENTRYTRSDEMIPCDYVGGACIIFKPDIIRKVGYLPECYFLFWEETEWCHQVKKAGLKCICTMDGSIHHKGSATISKIDGQGAYYLERNAIVFSRRNDRNVFRRMIAFVFINMKAIAKGFLRNKAFFRYPGYYFKGLFYRYDG